VYDLGSVTTGAASGGKVLGQYMLNTNSKISHILGELSEMKRTRTVAAILVEFGFLTHSNIIYKFM